MNWLKNIVLILVGMLFGLSCSFYVVNKYGGCPAVKGISCKIINELKPQENQSTTENDAQANISEPSFLYDKLHQSIPIFMYHHIKNNTQPNNAVEVGLDVAPRMFESHLQVLKSFGYTSLTMKGLTENKDFKPRYVALTFDDGYDDIYTEAFPLLEKYGMIGTVFLITDNIGKPGYLTQDQIKEMIAAGFEFGSHTITHPNLANANVANLKIQLKQSKYVMERLFDIKVVSFCYPSGKFNDQVVSIVKEAGYTNATTTVEGYTNSNSNLYLLPRLRVSGKAKLADFAKKIFDN